MCTLLFPDYVTPQECVWPFYRHKKIIQLNGLNLLIYFDICNIFFSEGWKMRLLVFKMNVNCCFTTCACGLLVSYKCPPLVILAYLGFKVLYYLNISKSPSKTPCFILKKDWRDSRCTLSQPCRSSKDNRVSQSLLFLFPFQQCHNICCLVCSNHIRTNCEIE